MPVVDRKCPQCHRRLAPNVQPGKPTRCAHCQATIVIEATVGDAAPPRPAPAGTPKMPAIIGPYQVRGLLGAGGFGVVYRGYHPQLERDVAIKALNARALSYPNALDRFRREAQVVAKMLHGNIVPVHDLIENDDGTFIVSSFIEGQTLADAIPEKGMAPRRAVTIAIKLLGAL